MTYSTSELINRAKQLADCANTDFLTNKEAEQYLNDAYNEVYQLAINRGDDAFVKKYNISNDATLPNDFFALRCVKSQSGYLYKRKSLDAADGETGYNIINNKIIISGNTNGAEITYYPKPMHLTVQAPEEQIGLNDNNYEIFDNNGHFFVYYKNNIHIYDMLNDTEIELETDYTPTKILCSKSTFFVFEDNLVSEYDYNNGNIIKTLNGYMPLKTKSELILWATLDNNTLLYNDTNTELEFEYEDEKAENILIADSIYYISNKGTLYKKSDEALVIDKNVDTRFLKYKNIDNNDGILYYKNKPMIFSFGLDQGGSLNKIRQNIDAEYVTFYGFTKDYMLYGDGLNMFKKGNTPDVIMNYPNATYYTLIAYTIATYLIAKQQGDVTILQAQREKALADYFNSASDEYNTVRITNIYG